MTRRTLGKIRTVPPRNRRHGDAPAPPMLEAFLAGIAVASALIFIFLLAREVFA